MNLNRVIDNDIMTLIEVTGGDDLYTLAKVEKRMSGRITFEHLKKELGFGEQAEIVRQMLKHNFL
ncbi:TPA: hypothetical protein I7682_17660 [Vibrio vulnificus]|nr:hypothetical protein [Vibrio vulnificus]